MSRRDTLLPPASQLTKLSDQQTKDVLAAVDKANQREHSYAIASLCAGTVSFLGVVAGFLELVLKGHAQAASALLGTAVLTVVARMIGSRLNQDEGRGTRYTSRI